MPPADALAGRSVSIVVPSFRPGPRFETHIAELVRVLAGRASARWEVVVVDDGCPDGSGDRIRALGLPGVRVLGYGRNRGKGYAIRYGMRHTMGDVVAFLDADGDIPADVVVDLAARVAAGQSDAVIGDKTHPHSTVQRPPVRRAITFLWGTVVQLLFGLPVADTQTGVKAWDGSLARRCAAACQEDGFAFDLEMLVLTASTGVEAYSAPVRITAADRESSIRPVHVLTMLRAASRLRLGSPALADAEASDAGTPRAAHTSIA